MTRRGRRTVASDREEAAEAWGSLSRARKVLAHARTRSRAAARATAPADRHRSEADASVVEHHARWRMKRALEALRRRGRFSALL